MILWAIKKVFFFLLQRSLLPDFVLRWRIRHGLRSTSSDINKGSVQFHQSKLRKFLAEIRTMPIALCQEKANEQHYELPAEFFEIVLGPRLKYSSCLWSDECTNLAQSEDAMLELYTDRAQLTDGQTVMDLGCGWGSLGLFVAERFPGCRVVALSNSTAQRRFIQDQCRARGLSNLQVVTGDIAVYDTEDFVGKFDRIMSIEMFEHMKNYEKLLAKLSAWLKPGGKVFVHIFSHIQHPYHFEKGWMAKTFFTGGTMPSHDLLLHFQQNLTLEDQWALSGTHYAKTLNSWLVKMDKNKGKVWKIMQSTYGADSLEWYLNWRLFFLVCAETFDYNCGNEWIVSHYLFSKR